MKKRAPSLALALGLCALLLFSACGGGSAPADLPMDAVYDTESESTLSLGDSKSIFDAALGAGETTDERDEDGYIMYTYLDDQSILVGFDDQNNFTTDLSSSRFSVHIFVNDGKATSYSITTF